MSQYKPPFETTDDMTLMVDEIGGKLSRISALVGLSSTQDQRKSARLRAIHASLAIEGNTLTIDQVTAIIDGKRV